MRPSTLLTAAAAYASTAFATSRPKNFIFIVPDGMSPASQTLVRTYLDALSSGMGIDQLPIGTTRTHSANNLVTDSGVAGTAFATGFKTNNGAIGVLPDGQPVGSIMEAAKMDGYLTVRYGQGDKRAACIGYRLDPVDGLLSR